MKETGLPVNAFDAVALKIIFPCHDSMLRCERSAWSIIPT